jgi:ABC-type multidrug transport system ATPase subunit
LEAIIATEKLNKTFKGLKAVEDLSFSINKGDVYGFLGQNGAGKSTTMRMLLGLIYPDGGYIYINGEKFSNKNRHLLSNIGAIIERPDMYGYLSGWDNLKIFAALSGKRIPVSRLHEVLEIVSLKGREKDKVKTYSQGMKQRLGIAIALVHSPQLLILDEPTNGLDPQGIAEMRSLILSLSKEHNKTILISSHLLYEIEQVASRMLVIHKGRKIVEGEVHTLLNPDETLVDVQMNPDERIAGKLKTSEWQQHLTGISHNTITLKMHRDRIPALNRWLVANEVAVHSIQSKHSLEAYFLSLTDDAATAHRAI